MTQSIPNTVIVIIQTNFNTFFIHRAQPHYSFRLFEFLNIRSQLQSGNYFRYHYLYFSIDFYKQFLNLTFRNIIEKFQRPKSHDSYISKDLTLPKLPILSKIAYEKIGDYTIIQQIGQGGFGKVFLAENSKNQKFALKLSFEKTARFFEVEENFLKILEPHKVTPEFIEAFPYKVQYAIVMQYCELSLPEYVKQQKLATVQLKHLMRLITQRIQVIHEQNIIHTDIKTDNFMIEQKDNINTLKIIDFSSSIQLPTTKFPKKLQSGYFRAPEVLYQCAYNYKIDMWGLGCVLFEIVFQRPLFPAANDEMLCLQQVALLGAPNYFVDSHFVFPTKQYFDTHQLQLFQCGVDESSKYYPKPNILQQNSREECKKRTLEELVISLGWNSENRDNFLQLLKGLLYCDVYERWDCQQVLECAFLKAK